MSAQMQVLARIGHRRHAINRRRYGAPVLALYRADERFVRPGLYLLVLGRMFHLGR